MVCPNCGEVTYRSHSRNFRESFVKSVSPLRPYRCHDCGWRGYGAPTKIKFSRTSRITVIAWIAGVFLAIAIGFSGSYLNLGGRPSSPPAANSGQP